jgi:cellulase
MQDSLLGERGQRVQFMSGATWPLQDLKSKAMACGQDAKPAGLIAPARAGSNITVFWSPWVESHRGPLTNYLAPYSGDLAKVDLNSLKFFKVAEEGLGADGVWSTDRMLKNNGTWTTVIPADIKPGTYVLRHELTALHFATQNSNYWYIPGGMVAPQFYISCYSVNITGTGTAQPKGVTFPGGYTPADEGLKFDIFVGKKSYPIPGPALYKSNTVAVPLKPNPWTVVSPTGDEQQDVEYMQTLQGELAQLGATGGFFNSIGG